MSKISEEATRLIDEFEYAVEDAVSDYMMAGGASYKNQARYNLEDYIAELEADKRRAEQMVERLIEAGESIQSDLEDEYFPLVIISRNQMWQALVAEWRNREVKA